MLAVLLTNSPLGPGFAAFWQREVGIVLGAGGFQLSLLHWVNDALLTIFFLVVGLEIKREFTVGHLASLRAAALPIAAALGGMIAPALIYIALVPRRSLVARLGRADGDRHGLRGRADRGDGRAGAGRAAHLPDRGGDRRRHRRNHRRRALLLRRTPPGRARGRGGRHGRAGAPQSLARLCARRPTSCSVCALWFFVHESGLHATLAGVVLALFIPTRQPPDFSALVAQATAILSTEARRSAEALHAGPSLTSLRVLDSIHDRLESPADRLLRRAGARSSYLVLPVFALANAGRRDHAGGARRTRGR